MQGIRPAQRFRPASAEYAGQHPRVTVSLDHPMFKEIRAMAIAGRRPLSEQVRLLVSKGLERCDGVAR